MSNKNRVPNIRFMGFKGEWAEKKFINCLAKIIDFRGKTPKKLGLSWSNNGKYRALSALNVKNGFIDKNIDVHFGNYDLYKKWMGNTELEKGDILFTTEAPMGNIAIIKDDEKYILSQRTIAFRVDAKNINGPFLLYKLNTVSTKNKLMSLSTGGTAQGISQKNLSYLFISVSNDLNEQQKIGDFFSKLDKLLDLQQQKIDKLELLKKALLQKLFPKYGAKIPELRFKEFKNEWEKEKLKGYIEKVSGNDGRMNLPTLTISAAKGWMNQNERFSNNIAGKEQKNYTLLKKGELSYNHGNSKLFKYGVVYELINYDEALVPKVYHSFRVNSKASARFIEYLFRGKKVDRELRKLVTSGARMDGLLNINFNNFENIQLYFPEKAEQQKIGNLLSKVDQLIELENKKLQDFQQVKKCLLQNMFVE